MILEFFSVIRAICETKRLKTEEEKKGEYEFYDRRENNVWERIIFPEKEEIYRIERKVLFEMYLEFPSFMNVLEEMKSTVREEEWSYVREKIIFSTNPNDSKEINSSSEWKF